MTVSHGQDMAGIGPAGNDRVRAFYNAIAFIYPLVDPWFAKWRRHVIRRINTLPKGRVLEIGVGLGAHLNGYKQASVTAIDLSEKMLAKARRRPVPPHTTLMRMDGEQLQFPDRSFDYLFLCRVLAITDDPECMIAEAIRVLKPGGLIYILNHETPGGWLRYLDRMLAPVARILNLSSCFNIHSIRSLAPLRPVFERSFGMFAYTKLSVFQK